MVNCGGCGKFLSPTGAVTCSLCPNKFHRACVGISDRGQACRDWSCPACKRNFRKGDNSQTSVKGIEEAGGSPSSSPGATSEDVVVETAAVVVDLRREVAESIAAMREFREELVQLRMSLSNLNERMSSVEERLDALEKRQDAGSAEEVVALERKVEELKLELNERDQEALLSDLDIGHLPEDKGVSATHEVTVLAARLGVALEARDVVFAERVGAAPAPGRAPGRPRRLVVRLARRGLRDELLRAARVRRGLAADGGARVFVNERLTRRNRVLFHRVREECGRLKWRYCWTKRGRIFARRMDGGPVYQFRSEDDLSRVFSDNCST
ncbi:uncharacterized protein LOC123665333 [Melitaea cinxia]|uniref:uncharacterized protein LOC123665333 n=1 Tax=Melitaea cinxia TaxID=113334 RepID=UPI001E272E06|nr:uncharacterized protein LOC123665333 [Melitaea cinxia]